MQYDELDHSKVKATGYTCFSDDLALAAVSFFVFLYLLESSFMKKNTSSTLVKFLSVRTLFLLVRKPHSFPRTHGVILL